MKGVQGETALGFPLLFKEKKLMEITSHLDYITRSFEKAYRPSDIIPQIGVLRVSEELGKIRQYERGYRLVCGGLLLLSSSEEQGSLIELSGKPLHEVRKSGISDTRLLDLLASSDYGRRTTRIDYCWNIPVSDVLKTLKHWNLGKVKTRIKSQPIVYGTNDPEKRKIANNGSSVYFGSKDSPQRVIVYDKAAELGLLSEALTRVEMRLRTPYASLMAVDMAEHGIKQAAQQKLREILDFPRIKWWQAMYRKDVIELSRHQANARNPIRYLTETIDPFMMNNYGSEDVAQVMVELMAKWSRAIYELHGEDES